MSDTDTQSVIVDTLGQKWSEANEQNLVNWIELWYSFTCLATEEEMVIKAVYKVLSLSLPLSLTLLWIGSDSHQSNNWLCQATFHLLFELLMPSHGLRWSLELFGPPSAHSFHEPSASSLSHAFSPYLHTWGILSMEDKRKQNSPPLTAHQALGHCSWFFFFLVWCFKCNNPIACLCTWSSL